MPSGESEGVQAPASQIHMVCAAALVVCGFRRRGDNTATPWCRNIVSPLKIWWMKLTAILMRNATEGRKPLMFRRRRVMVRSTPLVDGVAVLVHGVADGMSQQPNQQLAGAGAQDPAGGGVPQCCRLRL